MSGAADREADARARVCAQTVFDRPIVLEAGAGTGKTTVLVMRVVTWCLGPGWERAERSLAAEGDRAPTGERVATRVLEGVVAITFTEAAAAEMEHRIAEAFEMLSRGLPLPHAYEPALPPPPTRGSRARDLLISLDALEVRTIHGYCRRLLADHPLAAGVHPRFEVDASGTARSDLVRELLDEKLRSAAGDPVRDDLLALAVRGIDGALVEETLLGLLGEAVSPAALQEDPLAGDRCEALLERARVALGDFRRVVEPGVRSGQPSASARAALEAIAAIEACVAEPEDRGAERLARICGEVRERGSAWEGALQRWAGGRFGSRIGEVLGDGADPAQEIARRLFMLLAHLRLLDVDTLRRSHRVVSALLEEAEGRLRSLGVTSFGALLREARNLLAQSDGARRRERRRIAQLLVDEFQDTDALQCEIIAGLALGGDADERPGLFLVGDPKQSIYGWRNADLQAYDDMVERVLAAGGIRESLCCNHRSRPEILAEVDRVIAPAMTAREGLQPSYQHLQPRDDPPPPPGSGLAPVEHWVASDWEGGAPAALGSDRASEQEAEALAEELSALHEAGGLAWSDVGILLRGTSHLDTVLEALRERGIPFSVDRDRVYGQRREVLDATALVRAVLDPDDRLALVSTLRAAWVGVPDAAWPRLQHEGFFEAQAAVMRGDPEALGRVDEIARRVAAELAELRPSPPGVDRVEGWEGCLHEAARALAELHAAFASDPPDRFVERLRTRTLIEATEAARRLGEHRLRNLQRFFRDLESELWRRPGDVEAVLRYLRREPRETPEPEGAARPGGDAVWVMTVHGAKGLHFEHVYVLQLHRAQGRGVRSSAPVVGRVDGRLEYRWFSSEGEVRSVGYDRLQARREAVEVAERIRTLYVAMTRAKRRLVLSAGWLPGEGGKSAAGAHLDLVKAARASGAERALHRVQTGAEERTDVQEDGVRWVFLGRQSRQIVRARGRQRPGPQAAAVRETSLRLVELRRQARAYRQRAFGAPISGAAHAQLEATPASGSPPGPTRDGGAPWARAVGQAVHRFLEELPEEAWSEEGVWKAAAGAVRERLQAALPEASHRVAAWERAESLLERVRSGRIGERLHALQPHVVARELPLLALPSDSACGPVAYEAGALDLLYRDPDGGDLVVVDFKTDRVPGPDVLASRVRAYALQGRAYARALQDGLGLAAPPRVELWFLDADRIEQVS